ncbi:MAG: hypothetical protein QW728_05550 [Thermoplasmata archaeon]
MQSTRSSGTACSTNTSGKALQWTLNRYMAYYNVSVPYPADLDTTDWKQVAMYVLYGDPAFSPWTGKAGANEVDEWHNGIDEGLDQKPYNQTGTGKSQKAYYESEGIVGTQLPVETSRGTSGTGYTNYSNYSNYISIPSISSIPLIPNNIIKTLNTSKIANRWERDGRRD